MTFNCFNKQAKFDIAGLKNKFSDMCTEGGTHHHFVDDEKTDGAAGLRQKQRGKK